MFPDATKQIPSVSVFDDRTHLPNEICRCDLIDSPFCLCCWWHSYLHGDVFQVPPRRFPTQLQYSLSTLDSVDHLPGNIFQQDQADIPFCVSPLWRGSFTWRNFPGANKKILHSTSVLDGIQMPSSTNKQISGSFLHFLPQFFMVRFIYLKILSEHQQTDTTICLSPW